MAPTRKQLFAKPAWASKSKVVSDETDRKAKDVDSIDNDVTPIFSNKHIYEDIVAQERKRREKHAQRVKERGEKTLQQQEPSSDSVKVGRTKKRRISVHRSREHGGDEDGSGNEILDDLGDAEDTSFDLDKIGPSKRAKASNGPQTKHPRSSVSPTSTRTTRRTKREATAISLDSDEDGTASRKSHQSLRADEVPSKTKGTRQPSIDSDSEEDEYLRDLKRKARQDARMKKLGISTGDQNSVEKQTVSGSVAPSTLLTNPLQSPEQSGHQASQLITVTPIFDDPEVEILIETIIPHARPLVVKRRASQSLELLRKFWCQRNDLRADIASRMFFTWNGTRMYNSSTMRGILETLKKSHPTKDRSDPSHGKIVLEAVTDEIFAHRQQQQAKRQEEAEATRTNGDAETDEESRNPDAASDLNSKIPESSEVQRSGPVVKLICPDIEPLHMRLRPHTTVSLIIAAFRKQRQIDPSKQCWLSYDGGRLEGDQTVQEIGFEADDSVDVYLR